MLSARFDGFINKSQSQPTYKQTRYKRPITITTVSIVFEYVKQYCKQNFFVDFSDTEWHTYFRHRDCHCFQSNFVKSLLNTAYIDTVS